MEREGNEVLDSRKSNLNLDFESSQKLLQLKELHEGDVLNVKDDELTPKRKSNASSVPPSFKLLSRSALMWLQNHSSTMEQNFNTKEKTTKSSFLSKSVEPYDFSDIVDFAKSAAVAIGNGTIRSERPTRSGVSGTYFLKESFPNQKVLGVFKPSDEEPCMPNHTVSKSSSSTAESCLSEAVCKMFQHGLGAVKEAIAYLLDHGHFANVPQTVLASYNMNFSSADSDKQESGNNSLKTKTGAFQLYVPNLGDAEDYGPGIFSVEAVQRIAFFDLRVLNCDRHGGNLLVTRDKEKNELCLVPIDHGFILPEYFASYPWPVWMDWPQVKEPIVEEVKKYAATIDGEMDAKLITEEAGGFLSRKSTIVLRLMSLLLQRAVAKGLTLYDIGSLVYIRDPETESSDFYNIMKEATELAQVRNSHVLFDPISSSNQTFHSFHSKAENGRRYGEHEEPMFTMESDEHVDDIEFDSFLPLSCSAPDNSLQCSQQNFDLVQDEYLIRYAMKLFEERLEVLLEHKQTPKSGKYHNHIGYGHRLRGYSVLSNGDNPQVLNSLVSNADLIERSRQELLDKEHVTQREPPVELYDKDLETKSLREKRKMFV
eukprot:jgi/Galph1/2063/GphlegSOOS_G730.1